MWCKACQQDVPGVASLDGKSTICCARCNAPLSSGVSTALDASVEMSPGPAAETKSAASNSAAPPEATIDPKLPSLDLSNCELADELQAVLRVLKSLEAQGISTDPPTPRTRIDQPHTSPPAAHWPAGSADANKPDKRAKHNMRKKLRSRRPSFLSWTMLLLGMTTFMCGGVLLGWSLVTGRSELFDLGLPLTLGGQAALLIGVVFQLEGLWRGNRESSVTLDELGEQIRELHHATTMLGTTHSHSAKSFYLHMAEGASPMMLLADLKGQLDMLAMKMSQESR